MKLRTLRAVVSMAAAAATVAGLALATLSAPAQGATLTARNLPANGKILAVMGQDSNTLSAYKTQVLNNTSLGAPQPGGVTLYTNVVEGGSPAPLSGMFSAANRDQTRRPAQPLALPERRRECVHNPATRIAGRLPRTAARTGIDPSHPRRSSPYPKRPRGRERGLGHLAAWCCLGTRVFGLPVVSAMLDKIAPGGRGQVGPRKPPATEHTATSPRLPRPSGVIPVGAPIRREPNRPPAAKRADKQTTDRTEEPRPHLPAGRGAPFPERGPLRRSRRRPGPSRP